MLSAIGLIGNYCYKQRPAPNQSSALVNQQSLSANRESAPPAMVDLQTGLHAFDSGGYSRNSNRWPKVVNRWPKFCLDLCITRVRESPKITGKRSSGIFEQRIRVSLWLSWALDSCMLIQPKSEADRVCQMCASSAKLAETRPFSAGKIGFASC